MSLSDEIRSDFPLLEQLHSSGKGLVYLDNGATTQKPKEVIDALQQYYCEQNANVHRGLHDLAEKATVAYEGARDALASFIGAKREEIIFTRGTTESINLVAQTWARKELREGDTVLISEMEHHSNIVPWFLLREQTGIQVKFLPITPEGLIDMEVFQKSLSEGVRLVSLTHCSNVLGTINPIKEMTDQAHKAGAKILIDAAQGLPHMALNVKALDVDFLAFSGHKMLGPTGIGVLYAKQALLEEMPPFLGGGEMIDAVSVNGATWADLPYKFEAGTPHIAGAVGLGAAVGYLTRLGMDRVHDEVSQLAQETVAALSGVEGVQVYGPAGERGGAVSFNVDGMHPHDVSQILNEEGIAIRAGHLCCQPLMKTLGCTAVARASVYVYNHRDDIERLVSGLHTARNIFGL